MNIIFNDFWLDERLAATCFLLGDGPLSRILLKNNAHYPWLILVPRINNVQEIDELSTPLRVQLIEEISALSALVRAHFKPDKLNIGALGNIVPQLHIHIVARFSKDKLWPHSIWQAAQEEESYTEAVLLPLLENLRTAINSLFKK